MLSCDVVVLERGLLAETMSVGANFCGIAGFGANVAKFPEACRTLHQEWKTEGAQG